jgi:hypothetical protein
MGGWTNLNFETTLQGAPFKLGLDGCSVVAEPVAKTN